MDIEEQLIPKSRLRLREQEYRWVHRGGFDRLLAAALGQIHQTGR